MTEISTNLPEKFQQRGVDLHALNVDTLEKRREEYEHSWRTQLDYLIPDNDAITFEEAWKTTIEAIHRLSALIGN